MPFLLPDRQPYITNYPAGAVLGQFLEYWAVTKHIFNYSKIASKSATLLLTKREVAMISFFASIFYAVNARISLVRFGYIANGIN